MRQHEIIEGLFAEIETITEYLRDSYTYRDFQAADRLEWLVTDTRNQLEAQYSEFQYLSDMVQ